MADLPLEQLKELYYNKGYSAREISEVLGFSQEVVYDFMTKMKLPRRNLSEQNKIRFKRKPLSFKLKRNLTKEGKKLKIAGIMLYWAEGSLTKKEHTLDFANSDPEMIKIFLNFLRKICGIDEERLRVYIYCYANQNINKIFRYWHNLAKIPVSQFTKPYIRKDFEMKNNRVMKYGLIHIRYSDKKLVRLIKRWINEYVRKMGR